MIIDCFSFFNELDLLELRLNELRDVVDRFVLVESPVTFSNIAKPLFFRDNKSRFAKFGSRIQHLVADDYPSGRDNWAREYHQRNFAMRALKDCALEDIVLVSDVDEIPNPAVFHQLRKLEGPHALQQDLFYYFLNFRGGKWDGPVACRFKDLRERDLQSLRSERQKLPRIQNGGWHFSYLGGVQRVVEKLEAYAHQEYNKSSIKERKNLLFSMATGRDFLGRDLRFDLVAISTLPHTIQANPTRWDPLMAPKPDVAPGFTEDCYSETQRKDLEQAFRPVRYLDGAVVELGSWEGRSTVILANAAYPLDVFAVDTWAGNLAKGSEHPTVIAARNRDIFLKFACNIKHMTRNNVFPFVITSTDFLNRFRSPIKFCHIDACHDYRSVRADIEGALRLLVDGGVLCGDDLEGGVERAVRELLPGFRTKRNFWYWRKPSRFHARGLARFMAGHVPNSLAGSRFLRRYLREPTSVSTHDAFLSVHSDSQ